MSYDPYGMVSYGRRTAHGHWDFVTSYTPSPRGTKSLNGVSGDGTKVFCQTWESIWAWSIDTGEYMGGMEFKLEEDWYLDSLQMDDSRIWVQFGDLSIQGWEFGTSSSSLIPSSIGFTGRPLLDFIDGACWQDLRPSLITISGKEVFQLSGRHVEPWEVQWDGQYLIAGYGSGELLITDFCCLCPK